MLPLSYLAMCTCPVPVRIMILGLCVVFCTTFQKGALAAECGNVSAEGQCIDNDTTLQWCADGELMTAICPEGEICAKHEVFDGGAGCIDPAETPCGDIPAAGQCTTAGNVVWCLEGQVAHEPCVEGTSCLWDDTNDWYDCLPEGGGQRRTTTEGDGDAVGTADAANTEDFPSDAGPVPSDGNPANDTDDSVSLESENAMEPTRYETDIEPSGPTPHIQSGEAETESTEARHGGCAASHRPEHNFGLMLLVFLLALRFNSWRVLRHRAD